MIYVFDTSSFIVIGHFFHDRFPSFWERFDRYIEEGKIISVREVLAELDNQATRSHLKNWIASNKGIFLVPIEQELKFIREIFERQHFRQIIKAKDILNGKPVADPFVIAKAKAVNGIVVTEEVWKKNAAKIPNICSHYDIEYTNLEGFMTREGWEF
ncbi:MAG: DUF4411 family protein [candidate division Zixibacteria bacterium]|nr:DUF4411 family protein [Candidatus Tariuqbacter arcticus]